MRPLFPFIIGFLCCCWAGSLWGQTPAYTVYDSFPQLEARLRQSSSATLVVNFWATWCKPCVEELPQFEQLHQNYASANVKVLLVSLDFKTQLEQRLIPFLRDNKLSPEVIVLADQDADTWIPRVQSAWDGAIPITLVIKGGRSAFHRDQFKDYNELEAFVRPFLDPAANNTASRR